MENAFALARDAILLKRFSTPAVDDFAIPVVGDDIEYGKLKETKESRAERKGL